MSDLYETEIEAILKKAGMRVSSPQPAPKQIGFVQIIWIHIRRSMDGRVLSISSGRVMLVAVLFLLTALVLNTILPGFTGPLAWVGLILFIVGYGLFFLRPIRPSKTEKRWRGTVIDEEGHS